jgi:hypothetical protein
VPHKTEPLTNSLIPLAITPAHSQGAKTIGGIAKNLSHHSVIPCQTLLAAEKPVPQQITNITTKQPKQHREENPAEQTIRSSIIENQTRQKIQMEPAAKINPKC